MNSTERQELLSAIDNIIVKHIDNIIVKHLDDFKQQINSRLSKIEDEIKIVPCMQSNMETMQSNIKTMQSTIVQMQSDIKELQNNYKELYQETRNISRTVAKIEVEHGEKLAILFDAVTGNTQKQETLEKRLNKCEKRIDSNENQIYFLNSKIQNL